MKSTTHEHHPEREHPLPCMGSEAEGQEDWSAIWALEDPAISGAFPIGQDPLGQGLPGEAR